MPSARAVVLAFLGLFAVSTAFPIAAGLLPAERVPPVVGLADVAIAAVTTLAGFVLASRFGPLVGDGERALAFRIVQIGSAGLLVLLGLFLAGEALPQWSVLLAGLAWRA